MPYSVLDELSIDINQLLDTMAEGVVVLDTTGRIRLWNPAMTRISGYSREEALGKHFSWLRSPDCGHGAAIEAMLREPNVVVKSFDAVECRLKGENGSQIPVVINVRPVRNHEGKLLGLVQTLTDFRPVEQLRREVSLLMGNDGRQTSFHGLIGHDAKLQEVYRLLALAADSDATVLLLGESGTGKEVAANAIHHASHRHDGAFVTVNCGALSETILESELFGHVKGAFTGAYQDRIGRFEAADGGTILLDEIGEVSPAMQVKLLRVLQERTFEPVGSVKTKRVDVRVIAATNRKLTEEVRAGRFREDLYYRLRVFPITMPPLREHMDDVPLLINHFLRKFSVKTGKVIERLDEDALRAVMDYCWPGNVRELENVIEYAFVTCNADCAGLFDLPQELRRMELRREICLRRADENEAPAGVPVASASMKDSIVRSAEQLRHLLNDCDWNKAEVGRRLGISRTAVWSWMKNHDIPLQRD